MSVYGYIRVSTVEQAEEGYSLAAQEASLREHCQRQGWELAHIYADEGISAKDTNRPGLQSLLAEIGKGDILLVWKLDRLSRSVGDTEAIFGALDKLSASLVSVTEPHLSTAGASGVLVRQITAVFAEHYRNSLAENVRHGMAQLVKQGKWHGGPTPLGYDLQDGRLIPNGQADLVRRIYGMYASGLGVRSICSTLNAEGMRTPRGYEWSVHPVSHILRNPIYAGRIAYGLRDAKQRKRPGGPLLIAEGEHDGVVEPELWQQVQDILARRKRLPSRSVAGDYPLTGITRCGLCGSALRGMKRKRGRTAVKFFRREYWCYRRTNTGTCKLHALMANRLEAAFLDALEAWVDSDALQAEVAGTAEVVIDSGQITKELADIDRRLTRGWAAYESGAVDLTEYRMHAAPLKERKKHLLGEQQAQIEAPKRRSAADWREIVQQIRTAWNESTPAERKEIAHATGLAVTVYPGYAVRVSLG